MKYTRLRIANYRGVDSSEIEFDPRGVTLVQGPNEAGKTSLGEAIGILFEYPDSSKHNAVVAIRPVHRDAGSEIELEAESGPYKFKYFKQFHKKPSTKLTVTAPKPENHTGREAHDRAKEILAETLDVNLWKALTIQQGAAIDQPDLANQQSLSAALDKAAGGVPTDQAEEGLFEKVGDEFGRFFTPKGQEKGDLKNARVQGEKAESKVGEIEQQLRSLDQDAEDAARLQAELVKLKHREERLSAELADQETALHEISLLENQVSQFRLTLESAEKSAELARRAKQARQDVIEAVAAAATGHQEVLRSSAESMKRLEGAEAELKVAQASFKGVDANRKTADALEVLRRQDFDYYNDLLFLQQLSEREERIDVARKSAAHAQAALETNQVDEEALDEIKDAETRLLVAQARLETAAPRVKLLGLAKCDFQIDDRDASIASGEVREISVPDRLRIVIPDHVDIEVAAGSSIDQLTRQVTEAEDLIDAACRAAGVTNPDAARNAFENRQEALRVIEEKDRIERENLRDLSYDSLAEKLVGLEETVPAYLANRTSETEIAADLESAKEAWENAQGVQRQVLAAWESASESLTSARSVRDELSSEHESDRIELRSLESNLKQQQSQLNAVRETESDEALESTLKVAKDVVSATEAKVRESEAALKAKNPEKVRTLAETTKGSVTTNRKLREVKQTELTQVQTRLRIHGEEGLHEKLHAARTTLEMVTSNNRSLFRRAAAARLLFEIMRQERDEARRAYVAPLKEKIERLGRLVFDEAFQVDVDENLRIVSRTSNGVTVPFDFLSGGTKEQLSLIFRLACSLIVAEEGGMPLIMDDALGYTDSQRLRLMGAVLARAAKECQIVIFTCMPDRYANVGEAAIVSL